MRENVDLASIADMDIAAARVSMEQLVEALGQIIWEKKMEGGGKGAAELCAKCIGC